jgi:hypothetical protein
LPATRFSGPALDAGLHGLARRTSTRVVAVQCAVEKWARSSVSLGVTAVLVSVAVLASYFPARRRRRPTRSCASAPDWRPELPEGRQQVLEPAVARAIRDALGEVTHYIGIQSDVTARREAEDRLRRVNEALEQDLRLAARETAFV